MRELGLGLAVLATLAGVPEAWAQEAPKDKLNQVQQDLKESRERRQGLEAAARKLDQEMAELRQKSVQVARTVQAQEEAVAAVEARLANLLEEEAAKAAALEARRTELGLTLDALARLTRRPPQALLAAPGQAIDMVRSAQLLAAVAPEIKARADAVRDDLVQLASLRADVARQQERLGREIAALDDERARLERLRNETQANRLKVATESREEARRAQALAREAADLKTLIERLAEAERKRREQEARERAERVRAEAEARARAAAAATAAAQAPPPPARQAAPEPDDDENVKLAALSLPARGRIVGRFGETTESGAPRRGIVIATRAGAQVTAPAAGRVVFAGPFKGYGQLLIIAHSGGYHSLLSGFADIDASVGQRVVAGEPVGRMGSAERSGEARPQDARAGTAGEGGGPGLYVELRHKGDPVNPLPWLAQGDRKANG